MRWGTRRTEAPARHLRGAYVQQTAIKKGPPASALWVWLARRAGVRSSWWNLAKFDRAAFLYTRTNYIVNSSDPRLKEEHFLDIYCCIQHSSMAPSAFPNSNVACVRAKERNSTARRAHIHAAHIRHHTPTTTAHAQTRPRLFAYPLLPYTELASASSALRCSMCASSAPVSANSRAMPAGRAAARPASRSALTKW
jgi:hypothetical protein